MARNSGKGSSNGAASTPPAGKQTVIKGIPTSRFAKGRLKETTPLNAKKDGRHVLSMEGLQQGILVLWPEKGTAKEEPYIAPLYKELVDHPEVMEELCINAITYRKGEDGETAMKQNPTSTYDWKQLICIIGVEDNTSEARMEIADKIITHYNAGATTALYKYPKKMRFGRDLTQDPPRSVDALLLDKDVLGLMCTAYPKHRPEDLAEFDEIMEPFWTEIGHGRDFIENYQVEGENKDDEE
jgi:hypothetical protein